MKLLGEKFQEMLKRWDQFWFGPVDPFALCAFRLFFGVYLLFYLGSFANKIPLAFSSQGIYQPFLVGDIAPPPLGAYGLYFLMMACVLAFTVGYKTQVVTPALLILFLYHYFLNLAVKNHSYDRVILILLFVLCFARLNRVWSVERKSFDAKGEPLFIMGWAQKIICVYVILVYYGMAVYKVFNPLWHNGTMLYWNLMSEWASPVAFWLVNLDLPMSLYTFVTWAMILLELSLSLGLNKKSIQQYCFILGAGFHIGIYFLLNIPEFLFLPACYILFIDFSAQRPV